MPTTSREAVTTAVQEICGIDPALLVDDAELEVIGIDSIDLIEVAVVMEEQFDLALEEDHFDAVVTFGDAVAVFDRLIAARSDGDSK